MDRDEDSGTPRLNLGAPQVARVYNGALGGKSPYEADREATAATVAAMPTYELAARQNRLFLHRAVSLVVGEGGVRQILDIGTGLPTDTNTHDVAQRIAPETRVVYVDNDPLVLAHAAALLTSTPEGACDYVDSDVRDPARILEEAARTLDFSRPIAVVLGAVLHLLTDADEPYPIVARLVKTMAPGSYLVISHGTGDFAPEQMDAVVAAWRARGMSVQMRTHAQIARFFDGLDILDPGIVPTSQWRPALTPEVGHHPSPADVGVYAAVGRVPLG